MYISSLYGKYMFKKKKKKKKKYLTLVHILNEFVLPHKRSKGISNDIQSS